MTFECLITCQADSKIFVKTDGGRTTFKFTDPDTVEKQRLIHEQAETLQRIISLIGNRQALEGLTVEEAVKKLLKRAEDLQNYDRIKNEHAAMYTALLDINDAHKKLIGMLNELFNSLVQLAASSEDPEVRRVCEQLKGNLQAGGGASRTGSDNTQVRG